MPTHSSDKQSVLLVEDHADSRQILRFLLEELNYVVLEAKNGNEGFRLAVAHQPDLILTDFALPGIDGIELTRRVRGLGHRMKKIPIIIVTASQLDHHYQAALKAGCSAFLSKPIEFSELETLIDKLLHHDREDYRPEVMTHRAIRQELQT